MGCAVSSASFVVDAAGGEGATHRSIEEAWKAALESKATKIDITVREGTYNTAGEISMDITGREVLIIADGPVVIRTPRSKQEGVLKFVGNSGKVALRDLGFVGTVFLRAWKSEWEFERCSFSGEGFCCIYCVGGTLGYDGVGAHVRVLKSRVQNFGEKEGICFKSEKGHLHVEECEIDSGRCGVSVGGLAGCNAEVVGCHVHDCTEEGLRLLKPCAGRVAGNALWACKSPLLFSDGLSNACTPFPDVLVEDNDIQPGDAKSKGRPGGRGSLDAGPRPGGILTVLASKVEEGIRTVRKELEEGVTHLASEIEAEFEADPETAEMRRQGRSASFPGPGPASAASGTAAAAAAGARALRPDLADRLAAPRPQPGSASKEPSPSKSPPRDPRRWSVGDVRDWLRSIKFVEYETCFAEAKIDGARLLQVDAAEKLEAIGVREGLHFDALLQAIRELIPAESEQGALQAPPSPPSNSGPVPHSPSLPLASSQHPPRASTSPSQAPKIYGCFVSYAHVDQKAVAKYVDRLQAAGLSVWMDREIIPGRKWRKAIADAIAASSSFVCFLSEGFLNSENCEEELCYAHSKRVPLVPVWLEKVDPATALASHGDYEMILTNKQCIVQADESEGAVEAACREIVKGIRAINHATFSAQSGPPRLESS
eukprot:tig00020538_g10311.t1